jgi:hypothetical protein
MVRHDVNMFISVCTGVPKSNCVWTLLKPLFLTCGSGRPDQIAGQVLYVSRINLDKKKRKGSVGKAEGATT